MTDNISAGAAGGLMATVMLHLHVRWNNSAVWGETVKLNAELVDECEVMRR